MHAFIKKVNLETQISNKNFAKQIFANLIACTDLEEFLDLFSKFYIIFDRPKVSSSLLNQFHSIYDSSQEIVLEESDSLVDDFAVEMGNGVYSNTKFFNLVTDRIEEAVRADSANIVHVSNALHSPKFAKYLLTTFAATFPLWSSVYCQRSSNAIAECWNKIVKKDILNSDTFVKPGRFIKKSRKYTLSQLKLINCSIKPRSTRNDIEDFKEKWLRKKEKPKYFEKTVDTAVTTHDFADLLKDPATSDLEDLFLSTFVIVN